MDTFHGQVSDPHSYCDLNRPAPFGASLLNPVCFVDNPQPANRRPWPTPIEGCPDDINASGTVTPDAHFLADTKAIEARQADIKRFFDAGGGLFLGSGADNGDGHSGDRYYSFVDLPGGDQGSACNGDVGENCLGAALGFSSADVNCGIGAACATHNSFKPPRIGSPLLVAEHGDATRENTLFQDTNPPDTIVTSGPGAGIHTAGPPLPVPVLTTGDAAFGFHASEDTTTFQCANYIRVIRLAAVNVVAGTTLRLKCTGPGCRFTRTLRSKSKDVSRVDLLRVLRRHRLRAGTTIELRGTISGQIGSAKRLQVVRKRGGFDVKDTTLCSSPAAPTKLRRRCQTIN